MDRIVVLDFGSQTAQLIARRIREAGVYSVVLPGDSRAAHVLDPDTRGIVLSGSPSSIYTDGAPRIDSTLIAAGLPMLGICYGFHQLVTLLGGSVARGTSSEFGRARVHIGSGTATPLLKGVPDGFVSWMSHGDSVAALPEHFEVEARSDDFIAAAWSPEKRIYGLQFHPEVSHCEYGSEILSNFAVGICGASKDWNVERYLDDATANLLADVGDREVLLLISGGVDSSVVAGLLLATLPPERVHLMYVDTGLMRKDETPLVEKQLNTLGARNLHIVDASARFLGDLEGVSDPEEKRKIIGDAFIAVQQEKIDERKIATTMLAQGTLYTDLIESGKGVGDKAEVIKSHHNVRSPLVEAKRASGDLIEPLKHLYKDEVRALGRRLGVDERVIGRHPFPGPGLAVRIVGQVSKERCDTLREADAIFLAELEQRDLYDKIWQAFCVLLPVQSVGVTGDARNYGDVVALRAVTSRDGMTADVYPFEMSDLLEISARITNGVVGVGRVVYDVSSKPPATIEWE
jgi:GMP synthase (glutamine-hydrolysing)